MLLSASHAFAQSVPSAASTQRQNELLLSPNPDAIWRAPEIPNLIDNLPFSVFASQSVVYNDNILLLPNGAAAPPNRTRGDFYFLTNAGLTAKIPIASQVFFFDANYGISRYVHNTTLDGSNYLVDVGVNWVFTSRCSGKLVAIDRQTQAPIEELTSFSNNDIQTLSAKESAKCNVGDRFNIVADSEWNRTTNSLASLSSNNVEQFLIRGGVEYDIALLHTVGVKTTYTKSDYFDRTPFMVTFLGLASGLEQFEYAAYYKRLFSPKLEVDASVGFTETRVFGPVSKDSFSRPTYSVSVKWTATPKLSFVVTTAQSVSPPQNIVADFEQIRSNSISANYTYSPRLSFMASVGLSDLQNPTVSGISTSPILVDQHVIYGSLQAKYQISPMLDATAFYKYTHRKDDTAGTLATSNLVMFSINYKR